MCKESDEKGGKDDEEDGFEVKHGTVTLGTEDVFVPKPNGGDGLKGEVEGVEVVPGVQLAQYLQIFFYPGMFLLLVNHV